jgi:hypothetical protein
MTEPHDWPFEQPARGTLRPWYLTAAGYLAVLFPDGQEAQRATQGLLQRGVPANDVRLYDAEEVLSIASRLQPYQPGQPGKGRRDRPRFSASLGHPG